eukprot:3785668-Amphidinium_carterae.2
MPVRECLVKCGVAVVHNRILFAQQILPHIVTTGTTLGCDVPSPSSDGSISQKAMHILSMLLTMIKVRVTTMLVTQLDRISTNTAQVRHGSRACEIKCQSCQSALGNNCSHALEIMVTMTATVTRRCGSFGPHNTK